jgi:hypothetical protein
MNALKQSLRGRIRTCRPRCSMHSLVVTVRSRQRSCETPKGHQTSVSTSVAVSSRAKWSI